MILISLLIALLYIIFSLPKSFVLSNSIFKSTGLKMTFDNAPGIPTFYGILLHSFVFMLIVFLILKLKIRPAEKTIKIEKPKDLQSVN